MLMVRDACVNALRIAIRVAPVGDTVYPSTGKVHCSQWYGQELQEYQGEAAVVAANSAIRFSSDGIEVLRWTPKKRQPLKVIFLDTGELSFSGGFPYAATKA